MPIYEYQCCECETIVSESRATGDRSRSIDCENCKEGTMNKIMSLPADVQWKVR